MFTGLIWDIWDIELTTIFLIYQRFWFNSICLRNWFAGRPSFFSSFRDEGLKFNILAVSTVLLGGFITFILYRITSLDIENLVGIMSGAVTNTPGLGAAKNTIEELKLNFQTKHLQILHRICH
jgi:putative transport protein